MNNGIKLNNGEWISAEDDICLSVRFIVKKKIALKPGADSWLRVRRSKTKKYYIEMVNPNHKDGYGENGFLDTLHSWSEFYDVLIELLADCESADYVMGDERQFDSLRLSFPSCSYIQRTFDGEWMKGCASFRLVLSDKEVRKQYYNN